MNRKEFMELAEKCGYDECQVRERLNAYFDSPDGQRDLKSAPSALLYTAEGDKVTAHRTTKDTAISLLMQEIRGGVADAKKVKNIRRL